MLRTSEGFDHDQTLEELKEMYPADEDNDMEYEDAVLGVSVPQSIRDMAGCKDAMRALGAMIWLVPSRLVLDQSLTANTSMDRYLRTLNIDKDIMSMKNFNVYDPMQRGQGLVLDGQTLAHIEVLIVRIVVDVR